VLLCDTGVLLAAGNVKDHAHQACLRLLRHAEGPLLVPSPVLGEIGYLLQSRVGPRAEVPFLRSFGGDGFKGAGLQGAGIGRMAELVETYLDLPLGIVDAAVAAVAERLGLTEIATLDHRHGRPGHVAGDRSGHGDDIRERRRPAQERGGAAVPGRGRHAPASAPAARMPLIVR